MYIISMLFFSNDKVGKFKPNERKWYFPQMDKKLRNCPSFPSKVEKKVAFNKEKLFSKISHKQNFLSQTECNIWNQIWPCYNFLQTLNLNFKSTYNPVIFHIKYHWNIVHCVEIHSLWKFGFFNKTTWKNQKEKQRKKQRKL